MSDGSVVPFVTRGELGRVVCLDDLADRLRHSREHPGARPLRSPKTLLISLLISVEAALDEVGDVQEPPISSLRNNPAIDERLADVGYYLLHLCDLTETPIDKLLERRLDGRQLEETSSPGRRPTSFASRARS